MTSAEKAKQILEDFLNSLLAPLLEGFWWMLGAGILHSVYAPIPPIGYWVAVAASLFFGNADVRTATLRRIKRLTGEYK